MKRLPQRTSLVIQTAEILRESIAQWPRWLPGEVELARSLHVSRVTIRAALAMLEREKLIRAGQGRRREVIGPRSTLSGRSANRTVALLSPAPLHRLPGIFWIDELRAHLGASWPLEIYESAAAYRRRPGETLQELAGRLNPAVWVLYRSTLEMQRWFGQHASSAIIAGSRHPEVALSSVDVDYAAGCRHAAGVLLAAGHRHVALVRPDFGLAGDLAGVAGFQAGAGMEVPAALHDGSVKGIAVSLSRLFTRTPRPTALFVFDASHLLTVLGWLASNHLRVPRDVSVICRDDAPFLDSVFPSLARYTLNGALFARKISHLIMELVSGGTERPRTMKILPRFLPGDTLGKAAGR